MSAHPAAPPHAGGCLCGRVRYRIDAPLDDIAHCHCGMCRKSSGGIVTTWVTVPCETFTWTNGAPRSHASSPHTQRYFCGDCGAQLALHTTRASATMDVTIATLDEPQQHPARRHIWFNDHLPWLHLDENLPHEPHETL